MLGQIHVLVSILRRTTSYSILGYPSNAQTSHWSATYGATGLTHALLQDLLLAGLNASGFSESQRWDLVQAAEWAGEKIHISPIARWWPFEVLGRKMWAEEDVVEVSLAPSLLLFMEHSNSASMHDFSLYRLSRDGNYELSLVAGTERSVFAALHIPMNPLFTARTCIIHCSAPYAQNTNQKPRIC